MATFQPAETDYLFYVHKGDGSHAFARTYEEHLANVRLYLKGHVQPVDVSPPPQSAELSVGTTGSAEAAAVTTGNATTAVPALTADPASSGTKAPAAAGNDDNKSLTPKSKRPAVRPVRRDAVAHRGNV